MQMDDEANLDGLQTPAMDMRGLETPSGRESVASTVAGGLETPDFLELRKGGRGGTSTRDPTAVEPDSAGPKSLYQVIPERQTSGGTGFFQSEHTYDLGSARRAGGAGADVPVLGDERGTKVSKATAMQVSVSHILTHSFVPFAAQG